MNSESVKRTVRLVYDSCDANRTCWNAIIPVTLTHETAVSGRLATGTPDVRLLVGAAAAVRTLTLQGRGSVTRQLHILLGVHCNAGHEQIRAPRAPPLVK